VERPLFFLLHCFTTPAPPRTPPCLPSLSRCRQPRPHPKHHTAEYSLPNRSDPISDPCSDLPTSLPHHQSPPPRASLPVSPPPLSTTTNPIHHHVGLLPGHSTANHHRPNFTGKPPVLMGEEASLVFLVMDQKSIWARLTCWARLSTSVDPSPLQHCHFVFFRSNYSNSILIKVQTS
jgi:hypothetical protein